MKMKRIYYPADGLLLRMFDDLVHGQVEHKNQQISDKLIALDKF